MFRSCRSHAPFEQLESRYCPSGSYLYVAEYDNHQVLRYDALTGAFVDRFVPKHSGGLKEPQFLVIGPHDQNLYVGSGHFGGPLKAVLRYDGVTGKFLNEFTESGELHSVHSVLFGQDGNLYVGDHVLHANEPAQGRVLRFDGRTGTFLDEFVPFSSGGLRHPFGMVFGPGRGGGFDLFVADGPGNILRYDGTTGDFVEEFVAFGAGGLDFPIGIVFGPDGNLYVADLGFRSGIPQVLRYQGPTGTTPGAFIDTFVPAGSGGLLDVQAAIFGPDANGDGRQDLYVSNNRSTGRGQDKGSDGNIKRFDGVSGSFIDTFIPSARGGLNHPAGMTFTDTDPVTLAYDGGENLAASTVAVESVHETLAASAVQPLLTQAIARWQSAGADISGLASIDVRISDPSGALLGKPTPNTIWIDPSAAGWGWFVDPTPWDDFEFTKHGNQGDQNRIDLLTVVMHELGHLLDHDHDEQGVMAETLAVGARRTGFEHDDVSRVDQVWGQAADQHDVAWLGAWLNEQFDSIYGRAKRRR